MADEVQIDRPDVGVTRIRLHRPAARNAINPPMLQGLHDAFLAVREGAIVLSSSTAAAFCAGADLRLGDVERAALSDGLYALYATMLESPVPIVAALRGAAVGGGAQLALAADLRLAAPDAWLRFPGPGHGLAVGAWGLPGLVGRGRALDLCWTMRRVDALTAQRDGLVDRVEEDVDEAAVALAIQLAALDASAVARVKRVVAVAAGLHAALAEEREGNRRAWSGSIAGLGDPRGKTA